MVDQNLTHCCDCQEGGGTHPELLFGGVGRLHLFSLLLDLVCRVLEIPYDISFGRNGEKDDRVQMQTAENSHLFSLHF